MADSSFVVEALLGEGSEFEGEPLTVPDIAVAEVMNALYVQHHVLHLIEDGAPYLERLFKIIDVGAVQVVPSSIDVVLDAYQMASRHRRGTYDCLFVALALRSNSQLKTKDKGQAKLMEEERGKSEGETS